METIEFFQRVWPRTGHYCLDTKTKRGFKHHWFTSMEAAAEAVLALEMRHGTVYHACASFLEPINRKAANAEAVRSLWMDLDVGPEPTKFASIAEAGQQLKAFLTNTGLPTPMIVGSGGGLHVYWTFTTDVDPAAAHPAAQRLKMLAIHHGFKIDLTRTADFASVLRPVGSHNWKYELPRAVQAIFDGADYNFEDLAERIALNVEHLGLQPPAATPAKAAPKGVNAAFEVPVNYPDSDPDRVANQCAQIREMRASKGNVPEPQWYGAIQVLHFCKGGDEAIHQWSQGYAGYSAAETDSKIRQIATFGPTTCATFAQRNPDGCKSCPHRGSITSPIQLGAVYAELPAPVRGANAGEEEEEGELIPGSFVAPPFPFKRTPQGVVHTNADGIETIVYPYDLYLADLAYDEAGRHEVSVVRHHLPQEGWLEFSFRSSNVASDRDFEQAMRDNHVKPYRVALLKLYLSLYMQEIQKARRIRRLYASMGWKDGTDYFVLGEQAFYKDGTVQTVGVSPSVANIAKAFRVQGDRARWVEATRVLGGAGMEGHAMAFSAGPGSVLMKFTGFEGALFNTVGESNSGKTSIARFFTSMFGCFEEIKLQPKDTVNAKISRIGLLGSLPVYVDEMTNVDPEDVSDFVYEITQGRSKLRLKVDGSERTTAHWSTIVVSSSNTSLFNKLGLAKTNPEAERLRLFEFPLRRQPAFVGAPARELYDVCSANYGHVGPEFIKYVVTHQEEVKLGLRAMMDALREKSGAREEERMWIASVACGLYGLHLMAKLQLIQFDVRPVVKWAIEQLRIARGAMDDAEIDAIQILGQYFNDSAGFRVVLKKVGPPGKEEWLVERAPNAAVFIRYEISSHRIWVEMRHFMRYVVLQQGDWQKVQEQLSSMGVLVRKVRKCLGTGSGIPSTQVTCLEFNTQAEGMGEAMMALMRDGAQEKAA